MGVVDVQELVLLGGPAGAGKSTLARVWARRQLRSAVLELDEIRDFIVGGRADPQVVNETQAGQYFTSVRVTAAAARAFHSDGYSVVVEEVFPYDLFEQTWSPLLHGLPWKIVIIRPTLDETLTRSRGRAKRVREQHTRTQHQETAGWSESNQLDTTALSVEQSVAALQDLLAALPRGSV